MPRYKLTIVPSTRKLPLAKLMPMLADPFPAQRSHTEHLNEAHWLRTCKPLTWDQNVFVSVRYQDEHGVWKHYLIDGYTRLEAVSQQLMFPPVGGMVRLDTYVVQNYAEAVALYERLNNLGAAKRGKHEVQSGVREYCGKAEWQTHLLQKGPLPTGIKHSGMGTGSKRESARRAGPALTWLDNLGLKKVRETGGMMAAYIAIAHNELDREAAELFIQRVNQKNFTVDNLEDFAVAEARAYQEKRRQNETCSGTRNVDSMRNEVLAYFVEFRETRKTGMLHETAPGYTLGQYQNECKAIKLAMAA
jgi:hypothetical protein